MAKRLAIIGAGMGGLAAGIYGRKNGYETTIFEAHTLPGGQCTSYKRKGYVFDVCIHHLMGCCEKSRIFPLWKELGAMPRELIATRECSSVADSSGACFVDYYDLNRLEQHLHELAPSDSKAIRTYLKAIRSFVNRDPMGKLVFGPKAAGAVSMLGVMPQAGALFSSMDAFSRRFSSPLLRRGFRLLEYSLPEFPLMVHAVKKADGLKGAIAWPAGGAGTFAQSIADYYVSLGGAIEYRSAVSEIVTRNDRAVGVRLADGTEHPADRVISDADGRKTIMGMLQGRYLNDTIRAWCEPPAPNEATPWAVHVFLGVKRDLSGEPSAKAILLDKPVTVAGHAASSIELQTYGFDPSMAPPGKGVIKVELVSTPGYWQDLYQDRRRYEEEKQRIAATVIELLEPYFPRLSSQIETADVPTLCTWERYMGGTCGFNNMPKKKWSLTGSFFGRGFSTLPGLRDFYQVGAWATTAGALFLNANSGKQVIRWLCGRDGQPFRTE